MNQETVTDNAKCQRNGDLKSGKANSLSDRGVGNMGSAASCDSVSDAPNVHKERDIRSGKNSVMSLVNKINHKTHVPQKRHSRRKVEGNKDDAQIDEKTASMAIERTASLAIDPTTAVDDTEVEVHSDTTYPHDVEVHPDTTYPHDVWENELKAEVGKVENILRLDPKSPLQANSIRFVCLSDTHSVVEETDFASRVPAGDVLLHAGDFTYEGNLREYFKFNKFLGTLPHKLKLVIPGNHEYLLDPRETGYCGAMLQQRLGLPINSSREELLKGVKGVLGNAKVLVDELVEICGIKIYGVPWLPQYGMLGFGLQRGHQLLDKYNHIPANIDILMSHGPPVGFGDLTARNKHAGCVELHNSVRKRIKPKYVVCGHIHEGYGMRTDGRTTYINAAVCNKGYRPVHEPIVFDYVLPQPYTRKDFEKLTLDDLTLTSFATLGQIL